MSLRLLWIFCLIAAGAALTLTFMNQRNSYDETTVAVASNDNPTVSFENIDMIINSSTGLPQYEVSSPKYWLYQQEQRSEFESPDIVIYKSNGNKIFATSEKGETHNENDVLTLIGDVKITQPKTDAEPESLNIYTDKLTVSQTDQQATTDLPVTAIRGPEKITAIGMTLNLNDEILYLHKNVKALYKP